jgi:hypothetical protein
VFLDLVFSAVVLVVLNAMLSFVSLNMLVIFLIFGLKVCKCSPWVIVVLFGCVGFLLV